MALAAIAVSVFQLYHLFGLHVSKDLPLWDESAYIGWGDEFLQDGKVGSITNSPLYHIFYGVVIACFGLLRSFYVAQYALKIALTLVVLLATYRFSKSVWLSLLVGLFFANSNYHMNIDVLVYYGALIPYFLAILVATRAPALSLGLSFMAGLGRLEYMAVPLVHGLFLVWWHVRGKREPRAQGRRSAASACSPAAVWLVNLFVLSRVTVWQFHNRVWFAWSQNYAFFRYQTGRDSGGNPWLDHQVIAERDFPGAHSVAEAFSVNPGAVLAHTWYNIRELPRYLADFLVAHQNTQAWKFVPVYVVLGVLAAGALALCFMKGRRERLARWAFAERNEIVLCFAGIVAAAPGLIVSSKTNYIMPLVPAALLGIGGAHRLAAAGFPHYARWHGTVFGVVAAVFAITTFSVRPGYSTHYGRGPVYRDVQTMRQLLQPFRGLKILGVSTASYINYLGRANHHVFIEPLAISPVNPQAADLTLAGLVRTHDPDVLLINSNWKSSKSYASAVAGFDFAGWEAHPLVDGMLYLRAGLDLVPTFEAGWYEEESLGDLKWHWSRGDAEIGLANVRARPIMLQFQLRSLADRTVVVALDRAEIFRGRLIANERRTVELSLGRLDQGAHRLSFQTDAPGARPSGDDTRELAYCVEGLAVEYR